MIKIKSSVLYFIYLIALAGCGQARNSDNQLFVCINGDQDLIGLVALVTSLSSKYNLPGKANYDELIGEVYAINEHEKPGRIFISSVSSEGFGFVMTNEGLNERQFAFFFYDDPSGRSAASRLYSDFVRELSAKWTVNETRSEGGMVEPVRC